MHEEGRVERGERTREDGTYEHDSHGSEVIEHAGDLKESWREGRDWADIVGGEGKSVDG